VTRDVISHVALMASLGPLRVSGRSRHLAVCMRVPKAKLIRRVVHPALSIS